MRTTAERLPPTVATNGLEIADFAADIKIPAHHPVRGIVRPGYRHLAGEPGESFITQNTSESHYRSRKFDRGYPGCNGLMSYLPIERRVSISNGIGGTHEPVVCWRSFACGLCIRWGYIFLFLY
ncbi:hypothetical protein [Mesorhizobium huakuii]|uniref:hypothetical protein n=1 Tax=Mesorhizobium huakuii TaxID=28104 RepID=UPI0024E17954|nr:hypothetical protein [Mesorhizobium huakuii]